MIFYSIIIIFFVNLGFISLFNKKKEQILLGYYILFILAIISGLRFKTGTDWDAYYNLFYAGNNLDSYIKFYHFDIGYKILNYLFHSITNNYNIFLFIQTLIILLLKFPIIIKRPYYFLSFVVLMGVSLFDLFPTRQYLSVSLIILSIYCLIYGKYLISLLLMLIASLIHKVSIIVIPFAYFLYFNRDFKVIPFVGAIAALLFYWFLRWVGNLNPSGIFSYFIIQSKYYINIKTSLQLWKIFYYLLFALFIMRLYKNYNFYLNEFEKLSVKMFYFGIFFRMVLSLVGNDMLLRASWYFSQFEIFAVASLFYFFVIKHKNKEKYETIPIYYSFFVVFYILRFYMNIRHYYDLYVPFETVFSESFKQTY